MLKPVRDTKFYMKIIKKIVQGDTIDQRDYQNAYNHVAPTYSLWLGKMGQYTDRIIKPEYFPEKEPLKILDLACGTGYITKQVVEVLKVNAKITAVDISEDMLEQMDLAAKGQVNVVNSDAITYLKETKDRFDIIFCGWALPYFNHNELIQLCKMHLKNNGIMAVISNSKGTLNKVESVFIDVMKEYQCKVNRPMNIGLNLVKDKTMLSKWFYKYGFETLESGEDEVEFSFDKAEELYDWIGKTGAIAGTKEIFNDYSLVEEAVIKGLEKEKGRAGKYWINHKFAYGIFRLNSKRS